MKNSYFQRHLIEEAYKTGQPWDGQMRLAAEDKPFNAEYEKWTDFILKGQQGPKTNGVTSGHDYHNSAAQEEKLRAFRDDAIVG